MGGIRIEGKASAESFFDGRNAGIYPDSHLFAWIALENDSHQFLVYKYDSLTGKVTNSSAFARITVASSSSLTQAKAAIGEAEKLPQIELFRWRAYAVAINATSQQNGSWDIEYYDPVVRAQMANSGPVFRPALKGYGSVWVRVEDGVGRIVD